MSPRGHVGAPAVAGARVYLETPFPHTLFALDLAHPEAPELWRYTAKPDGRAAGLACCGGAVGGPVVDGALVVMATVDGRVIALNAADGGVSWDVQIADLNNGETLREAPLVADGKVFVGESGDDNGARGWVAALDEKTGRELWRRYSTGPDAEVGIHSVQGADEGVSSWPSGGWRHGGGGLAGPILYDPDAHLIFYATGHPAPWNPDQRPGDNKWTAGIFARDAGSGEALWFRGFSPHDPFAFGAFAAGALATREIDGAQRKLLLHADPDGYVYALDRSTGAILSTAPYVAGNVSEGFDARTGAVRIRSERAARQDVTQRDLCPGWPGALSAPPTLSPDGKLLLIPASRLCMDMEARNVSYIKGTAFVGADLRLKNPPDGAGGALIAWDIAANSPAWTLREPFPIASTPLVIAPDAVLYGSLDGELKAVDLATGRALGHRRLASGIVSSPVAFRDPDGRELIAVLASMGGRFGRAAERDIDVRDATAAHGLGNLRPTPPKPDDYSGRLYLFAP